MTQWLLVIFRRRRELGEFIYYKGYPVIVGDASNNNQAAPYFTVYRDPRPTWALLNQRGLLYGKKPYGLYALERRSNLDFECSVFDTSPRDRGVKLYA